MQHSIDFDILCFNFYFIFLISPFLAIGFSNLGCLIFTCLWIFQLSSCWWFLVLYHHGCKWYVIWFQSTQFVNTCFVTYYMIYFRECSVCTESMCILLLSSGMFYVSIRFNWSKVWIKFNFTLLISCLFALFTIASRVLKIRTIFLLPPCSFRSFSICLTFRCFDTGCNFLSLLYLLDKLTSSSV